MSTGWIRDAYRRLAAAGGSRASRAAARAAAAFCPGCRANLMAEPGTTYTDTDLVRYVCGKCGTRSSWEFGPPAPIRIKEPTP